MMLRENENHDVKTFVVAIPAGSAGAFHLREAPTHGAWSAGEA